VNLREERIGQVRINNRGSAMEVVEYKRAQDILVRFESGEIVHTNWKAFDTGDVKSRFDKSVYGVGYLGDGKYKSKIDGKISNQYSTWVSIMERCYSSYSSERYPSYKNSTVCDEWHNFQNFGKWYDENHYEIEGEKMELDKDILHKKNKIYSPTNCIFVHKRLNLLLVKKEASRGDMPIGVCFYKRDQNYQADCKDENGKSVHLGRYNSPESAFNAYKSFKEKTIRIVADSYKGRIPDRLYKALLDYKVEIDD
jgi:hypothetical protein